MWAGRKSAFPAVGRISPDYYCMDGTIPRRFLARVLKEIAELSEHYGLTVANVFHAGDGNLHPLILYDANHPGELTQFHAVKRAFDERGLLNPGKAVPTLQRCAEFGAMHVHQGNLCHPELGRF